MDKKEDLVQLIDINKVKLSSFDIRDKEAEKDKEPKLAAEVSKLMSTKYGWNEGLIVELVYH